MLLSRAGSLCVWHVWGRVLLCTAQSSPRAGLGAPAPFVVQNQAEAPRSCWSWQGGRRALWALGRARWSSSSHPRAILAGHSAAVGCGHTEGLLLTFRGEWGRYGHRPAISTLQGVCMEYWWIWASEWLISMQSSSKGLTWDLFNCQKSCRLLGLAYSSIICFIFTCWELN